MSEADLNVLEALVKTEHWMELRHWVPQLNVLFANYRAMRQRMTEMAVEHLDAVAIAYHDGAKDMRDKCQKVLAGSYDAGAAGLVKSVPLPERTLSLL